MNLEVRKLNLINWISSIQESELIEKLEALQLEGSDWWDQISEEDREAIEEGLEQLDRGESLSRSEVRERIQAKYKF